MNDLQKQVGEIGVVPVIKLTNPQRDAGPLSDALYTLCAMTYVAIVMSRRIY